MHVREATSADLPYLADIGFAAFESDELETFVFPRRAQYPQSSRYERLLHCKRRFYSGHAVWVSVTDEKDPDWNGHETLTGYSFITPHLPGEKGGVLRGSPLNTAFERRAIDLESCYRRVFGLNPALDHSRMREFSELDSVFSVDGVPFYWKVESLCVSPDFQRRGIGSLLLQATFDKAKKDQVPVVLVASATGLNLYLKHGFEESGRVSLPGTSTTWASLIWRPSGTETM